MNPKDYQVGTPVMVRGREVRVNVDDINRYFRTELSEDQEENIRDGVTWDDLFNGRNLNLANALPLNVEHIVKACIVTVGESRNHMQPLLFPCLIIELCRRASVDFRDDPFQDPMTDIGMGTWTTLKIERDLTNQRRKMGRRKNISEAGPSRQPHELLDKMGCEPEYMD
ncbi:hypothetical protein LWI29_016660 [Acer saccharum]|uniref:Uncharacterized protein n=1 Tax=Acer saccharum TaxID=4024 RepID=A0AA39S8A3_ACESA|nr:hypothetical protein LWI29_016660 [Acer saccharum]KAK1562273.1 hypothetical protein Q3G72_009232 [Acer saccharum]KAK1565248.1 hypothetical protein Q3G72_022469 [Acer saccharum]